MVDNMFESMYLLECLFNSNVHGCYFMLRLWIRSQNVDRSIGNSTVYLSLEENITFFNEITLSLLIELVYVDAGTC